ncbi:hypothetical protein ScPMuIL_004286 [Solemya velum]
MGHRLQELAVVVNTEEIQLTYQYHTQGIDWEKMAQSEEPEIPVVEEEDEEKTAYKAPAKKAITDIVASDKEDESLQRYKAQLLGQALSDPTLVVFPEDPRLVIVNKLSLVVEGRPDVDLDLTGDLKKLKESVFTIKEGCQYKLKVSFYCQRDLVSGLHYLQKVYRKGIKVDQSKFMVGSYGPKKELQSYTTPIEDAPSGMLARGTYTVQSKFTDDDKASHLEWTWKFEIKKDWD